MKLHILSPHPDALGMGFVFVGDGGRTLVIDGGLDDVGHTACAGYLFSELQRITGKMRPYVDAWIFTHPHSDHVGEFCRMVEEHNSDFGVRRFYFHFPSLPFAERFFSPEDVQWYGRFAAAYDRFFHDGNAFAHHCPVCAGDCFELDGIRVEFLRVPNENITVNVPNNSSIVFRLQAAGQRFLFLGDLGEEGGNELAAQYGQALKCDVCQMAHHGQRGVGANVYELAAPQLCLFTPPKWCWENVGRNGAGTGPYRCAETLAFPAVSRAEHYLAFPCGTTEHTLPLKP